MRKLVLSISLALIATQPLLAESHLTRPDPKIGQGFADVMAGQFQNHYGIDRAHADCLIYEVMTYLREHGYEKTNMEVAEIVRGKCDV